MLKELKVVLSTSIAKLRKGMRDAVSVTQTTAKQTSAAADKINKSMNNAFGGDLRNNIDGINFELNETKQLLVEQKQALKDLQKEQSKVVKDGKRYKQLANSIRDQKQEIGETTNRLAAMNAELRKNKTNLANSRLAAEDNQSALESMSRTLTAVTGAVLLMDSENESLRNTMKVLNVTFAATNAVVSINNLKLRENQLFLKASAAAGKLFGTSMEGASASMKGLRAVLSTIGIGVVLIGVSKLVSKIMDMVEESQKASKAQKEFNDTIAESGKGISKTKVTQRI